MTDFDRQLAAVLAAPDDDLPRLGFSDWLLEFGNAWDAQRAEFIQVQVELASFEPPNYPGLVVCEGKGSPARAGSRKRCRCRPCVLRRRERELLDNYIDAGDTIRLSNRVLWFAGANLPATVFFLPEYRRGFVEKVTCGWPEWEGNASTLLKMHPIREVKLTSRPELLWVRQPNQSVLCHLRDGPAELFTYVQGKGPMPSFHQALVERRPKEGATSYVIREVLARRWLGIDFTMPPPRGEDMTEINRLLQRIREQPAAGPVEP